MRSGAANWHEPTMRSGAANGSLPERSGHQATIAGPDTRPSHCETIGLHGNASGLSARLARGGTMKPNRFTEDRISGILREQESGATTADVP